MAGQVAAMWKLSISLHDGRAGALADWDVLGLGAEEVSVGARDETTRLAQRWNALLACVDEWLAEAVRPLLIQRRGRPTFVLDSWWLYGALGLQLALAVCGARSFLVCEGCGEFFEVKRARRYCEDCGLRVAWQRASKKLYASKQQVKRLAQEGRSTAQIATMLGRRRSQVSRWSHAAGKSGRRGRPR
jgi:transposase-like protein